MGMNLAYCLCGIKYISGYRVHKIYSSEIQLPNAANYVDADDCTNSLHKYYTCPDTRRTSVRNKSKWKLMP